MELILEGRSSSGIVKDYYQNIGVTAKDGYKEVPFHLPTLLDMVRVDPILFTAISLTADLCTYKGYSFLGDNKRALKEVKKIFDDKLDFDQVIDNLIWQMLIYGNAYLELVWNTEKTEIQELHPLESSNMVINYTEHGEIISFAQKIDGKNKNEYPQFNTDEVIFFRQFWIGSQVYGYAPFDAIARPFSCRLQANQYLQSLFMNLPPKVIYFLKNANEKQLKDFLQSLIRAKNTPNSDIIAQGEAFESKIIPVPFDAQLMSVLEYLRKEVLMITRVPPHWVGMLDGANRGIGENVVIPYETKIKKIQQKIESQINKELMSKLGYPNVTFKWNSISLLDEKSIVEIMSMLKSQGFDSETIITYAREHGLKLRDDAFIEQVESNQKLQNDTAQSRIRANAKTNRMSNELDQKGVSLAGKEKLEEEKVSL